MQQVIQNGFYEFYDKIQITDKIQTFFRFIYEKFKIQTISENSDHRQGLQGIKMTPKNKSIDPKCFEKFKCPRLKINSYSNIQQIKVR